MTLLRNLTGTNPSGGDAPNVADVFSTYLYEGTGAAQSIDNGINLGDFGVGTSTEFDGTNDYLSRSSDLTGNTDSKTFTFSCWIWPEHDGSWAIYSIDTFKFRIYGSASQTLIIGRNSANTNIYYYDTNNALPKQSWSHLIVSVDLTNTSRNHIYINEIDKSTYSTFTNDNIDFTNTSHYIANSQSSGYEFKGRLAHVFLDYTYRDLSTTSNRRLFIDSNGGSTPPSTLSALNPIMYLPMTDGYTIGENIGTGGDFTANGSPTIINKGTEYVAGSGEGGMVWTKQRNSSNSHALVDTERGAKNTARSDTTDPAYDFETVTGFNSNGYTINTSTWVNVNTGTYASWTFRKAERFFDVVTYTGNGTAGREIAHDLGVAPGWLVVKCTSAARNWCTYHVSLGNGNQIILSGSAALESTALWDYTTPTATEFTLGNDADVNGSGNSYVAYLFAHDPDGEDDDGMIACGSWASGFTGNISLGWEPQYMLWKASSGTSDWKIFDSMRGITTGGNDAKLKADDSSAETSSADRVDLNADGFSVNANFGEDFIYMAIRAPMMKEPEAGTEVFAIDQGDGVTSGPAMVSDFPVDMYLNRAITTAQMAANSRITGAFQVYTDSIDAETGSGANFDYNTGIGAGTFGTAYYAWMFKRAKGFFDVVAYTGNGVLGRTVNHSLSVAPEMMWVKERGVTGNWNVFHKDTPDYGGDGGAGANLNLNSSAAPTTSDAWWADTYPTASVFSVGDYLTNTNNGTLIAYLFATLDGVSKVGSYTGNGSSQNIDCGFSGGARFVLIKRTNLIGDWYMWDTERGIVAGDDPHLSLNTTAAQVTSNDSIDPLSSGFTVNQVAATNINVTNGTYIFLAIA